MLYERHGMIDSPEYAAWHAMKDRCSNPKAPSWHRYGGRGITICDRWKDSFTNFYADMGPRQSDRHSIDRINNDGNYEPSNCRWATNVEQSYNRANTLTITLPNGDQVNTAEAREALNLKRGTFYSRHYRDTPLEIPVPERELHLYKGQYLNTTELAKYSPEGVTAQVISIRIWDGHPVERAVELPISKTDLHIFGYDLLTIPDIAERTGLKAHNIRHHIRRNKLSAEQAVNFMLYGEVVKGMRTPEAAGRGNKKEYEYQGKFYQVSGLAKLSGLPANVITDRLHSGMSVENALTQPIKQTKLYQFNDKEYTFNDLLAITNLSRTTLRRYLESGLTLDDILAKISK